jgi:phosphatidylglycerophosphate synthase
VSFFGQVAAIYRETRKPKDILWDRFVARPLAAVLLLPLARTRITPNQVTFLSLAVFVAAMALLALQPGYPWLVGAVLVLELSYVLDCLDGQLARLRHRSSPVGAHLDFLMDELKAFLLVAACGVRLWRRDGHELWLLEALLGLAVVACAISLTTFMRRPEYLAATGSARPHAAGDYGEGFAREAAPVRPTSIIGLVEDLGRFLIHYPSYILFVALADGLEVFLHVYLAVTAAYLGRSLLSVVLKLGRS